MKTTVSEARKNLAELIGKVQYGGERVVLERHGKPVAAIVHAEDLEMLEKLEDRLLGDMAAEALAEYRKNPVGYTLEDVFADLDRTDASNQDDAA